MQVSAPSTLGGAAPPPFAADPDATAQQDTQEQDSTTGNGGGASSLKDLLPDSALSPNIALQLQAKPQAQTPQQTAQARQATIGPPQGYLADLEGIAQSDQSVGDKLKMAWDTTKYHWRNSDTAQGSAQIAGGSLEVAGGLALTGASDGLAAAVGVPVALHGADTIGTGIDRIWYGGDGQTATYKAVQTATGSPALAGAVDQGIPFLAGVTSVGQGLRLAENQVFGQTVYRGLTAQDAAGIEQGLGITAKNPNGVWTLEQHVLNKGPQVGGAARNDPWIATTHEYEVADAYRRGPSGTDTGNGIVEMYLGKVPAQNQVEYWTSASRSNIYDTSKAYHRSIWGQEVSVYQHIPQQAIGTPLSHAPVYQPIIRGLTIGSSEFTTKSENKQ